MDSSAYWMRKANRGLTHPNQMARKAWAGRLDFTPTPEQVERGLTDVSAAVRIAWLQRADFIPTSEQMDRGLTDESSMVRDEWIKKVRWCADKEMDSWSSIEVFL